MSLFFKLIILFFLSIGPSLARDIILITYQGQRGEELALHAQDYLTRELRIPKSFIRLRQSASPCQVKGRPHIQFCLNDQGELWPIIFDESVVIEQFRIFIGDRE